VSAISKNDLMINEEIRDKEVRLIDEDGTPLGIVPIKDAQRIANQKSLDLAKIAPQAVPPVCKIMDYGKYTFELNKKEKESKKNQKVVSIKEVRMNIGIEEHDFNVKLRNGIKFLQDGDKVKVTVKFVGREMNYTKVGEDLINRFADAVAECGVMDKKPKQEGKRMTVIINAK